MGIRAWTFTNLKQHWNIFSDFLCIPFGWPIYHYNTANSISGIIATGVLHFYPPLIGSLILNFVFLGGAGWGACVFKGGLSESFWIKGSFIKQTKEMQHTSTLPTMHEIQYHICFYVLQYSWYKAFMTNDDLFPCANVYFLSPPLTYVDQHYLRFLSNRIRDLWLYLWKDALPLNWQ